MAAEKIGRRLYEYVQRDGSTKSYYTDVEMVDGATGRRAQKRIKLDARNRSQARTAQADLISKLERHEYAMPTSATVRDVGEAWLRSLDAKPRTVESYSYHLRLNIYPQLGGRKIQGIRPQDIADLIAWLRDTRRVSGETATGAVRTLSGLMAHAVWTGLIPANPVTIVPKSKRPKRQRNGHRYLSSEEIPCLLEATTETYEPVNYVGVWTGMRENELLGLIWGDVDLKGSKINVSKQLSRPKKDRPAERVPVKTDFERTIDIDPELVAFLKTHKERAFGLGFAKETDYVFTTESGQPLHFRNLGKAFTKAADRADLNPEGKRKLRFHDLRRTYASILIEGGCEGPYIAAQLGHSVEVLYSTYAGLFNSRGQSEKSLAAIQAARGGASS